MPGMEALLIAVGSGLVTGLVTWGGLRVELRYLRRDVDHAHHRLDAFERRLRRLPDPG